MRVIKRIRVDEDLWKEAKDLGLNISGYLEVRLSEYIDFMKKSSPIPLNGDNPVSPLRARSLDWIGRQPPKL